MQTFHVEVSCGSLSWNGSSWKSIFNPDTHSNIFESFVRIFQFYKKYCSIPARGKFPFSPIGKRFSTKGCKCFSWCIDEISGKCVFGRVSLYWERFPSFLRKLLPNGLLGWWCWFTSTEVRNCEWHKSPPHPAYVMRGLSKGPFVTVTHATFPIYFLGLFLCLSCSYHVLSKCLAKKFFGTFFEKRGLVF